MNKYTIVIAGVLITNLVLNEVIEDKHYFIGRDHTHEDYSYLFRNYCARSVVAATFSGDRVIL